MVKTSVCDTDVVSSILATYPNAEMADWLCSGLQPRLGRFNSGSLLQYIWEDSKDGLCGGLKSRGWWIVTTSSHHIPL